MFVAPGIMLILCEYRNIQEIIIFCLVKSTVKVILWRGSIFLAEDLKSKFYRIHEIIHSKFAELKLQPHCIPQSPTQLNQL